LEKVFSKRDHEFESAFLQRRVSELSVPRRQAIPRQDRHQTVAQILVEHAAMRKDNLDHLREILDRRISTLNSTGVIAPERPDHIGRDKERVVCEASGEVHVIPDDGVFHALGHTDGSGKGFASGQSDADLESANKYYGTAVLLSGTTVAALKAPAVLRRLDLIRVKGQSRPTWVYESLGHHTAETFPKLAPVITAYEAGLDCYQRRDWKGGLRQFGEALDLAPHD
jgi:hypothetical protein